MQGRRKEHAGRRGCGRLGRHASLCYHCPFSRRYLARGTTGPYLAGIYLARVSGSGSMFGGFDEETETIDETRWLRIQMVSMEPVWAGAHLKTPFDRSE